MAAFQPLQDVYRKSVQWEEALSDLYDVAARGLKQPESRQVVKELHGEHARQLKILEAVDVARFGHAEWVSHPPDIDDDRMVPVGEFTRDTPPDKILRLIIGFEDRLVDFYHCVQERLLVSGAKELFASLETFKRNQSDGMRRLLKEYETEE